MLEFYEDPRYTDEIRQIDIIRLKREIKELEQLIEYSREMKFTDFNILAIINIKNLKKNRLAEIQIQ